MISLKSVLRRVMEQLPFRIPDDPHLRYDVSKIIGTLEIDELPQMPQIEYPPFLQCRIAEIKKRRASISKGKWEGNPHRDGYRRWASVWNDNAVIIHCCSLNKESDARFIGHAPDDIDFLLGLLKPLSAAKKGVNILRDEIYQIVIDCLVSDDKNRACNAVDKIEDLLKI